MRTGIGAVVLAAVVVLAAAVPAAAGTATTWTVSPGGKITATAGKTTLTDVPTGAVMTCQSSHLSGTLKAGTGLSGAGIGSLGTAVYSLCSGGPFPATVTAGGLPWRLNLSSYSRSTGVARGTISHLQIATTTSFTPCTAVIKGTSGTAPDGVASVSYNRTNGILKFLATGGNLHWYHVSRCAGIIRNGDAATISASYTVTPRQIITSP